MHEDEPFPYSHRKIDEAGQNVFRVKTHVGCLHGAARCEEPQVSRPNSCVLYIRLPLQ
jgi:hypothetical protein